MTKALSEQDIQQILRGVTIPSPPQIITDLRTEMAKSEPCFNTITKLISGDVGLAGSILKTANSPFYGGGGRFASINQAVMILGMGTVMDIVNTVSLRNAMTQMKDLPPGLFAALSRFWDSATDVARACAMVADKIRLPARDRAYSLGLFHNAGVPLMMLKYKNYLDTLRDAYATEGERIVDIENRRHDTNHAVMSFFVARSWKLPGNLCDLIAAHHNLDPFLKGDGKDSAVHQLLAILKIAEHLAGLHRVVGKQEQDWEWERIGARAVELAGLSEFDFDDLESQARELGLGEQEYFA
jgi:HD-like signal output (HDOD) protein